MCAAASLAVSTKEGANQCTPLADTAANPANRSPSWPRLGRGAEGAFSGCNTCNTYIGTAAGVAGSAHARWGRAATVARVCPGSARRPRRAYSDSAYHDLTS